jgi:hypothetical protein
LRHRGWGRGTESIKEGRSGHTAKRGARRWSSRRGRSGGRSNDGRGQLGGNKVQGAAAKVDEVAVHQVMGKLGWGGAQGVTRPRAYHSF